MKIYPYMQQPLELDTHFLQLNHFYLKRTIKCATLEKIGLFSVPNVLITVKIFLTITVFTLILRSVSYHKLGKSSSLNN